MPNILDTLTNQYHTGYPILAKLFSLSDKELKQKMKSFIDPNNPFYDCIDKADVIKTIRNEKYEGIRLDFYDCIEISPFGISYHPEHSEPIKLRSLTEINI